MATMGAIQSLPRAWRAVLSPLEAAAIEMLLRAGATFETGLAASLAIRAELSGDSFVDLACYSNTVAGIFDERSEPLRWPELQPWLSALQRCPMARLPSYPVPDQSADQGTQAIPAPGPHALVLAGTRVYLHRLWRIEAELATLICRIVSSGHGKAPQTQTPNEHEETSVSLQRASLALNQRHFCLLTGGPGTGKTTAAARLLLSAARARFEQTTRAPLVALCAPTGKAAARLGEAFSAELAGLLTASDPPELVRCLNAPRSQTVHRLLGFQPALDRFQASAAAPLAVDILLVDEASMLSLPLMHALFSALAPDTNVLLLGDANQLSAVESGTPFADLLRVATQGNTILSGCAIELRRQWRANAGLNAAAQAIRSIGQGGIEPAMNALSAFRQSVAAPQLILQSQVEAGLWDALFTATHIEGAWAQMNAMRVLCILHAGPAGQIQANQSIALALRRRFKIPLAQPNFRGQLLMATTNDYPLGVMNGDVGLCWPDAEGKLVIYFSTQKSAPEADVRADDGVVGDGNTGHPRRTGETANLLTAFAPKRLTELVPAFAMTVHKAQGSEFGAVTLILPELDAIQLAKIGLHRALIYTAVTRAKSQLVICASAAALAAGLIHQAPRNSGLAARLGCRDRTLAD
jgi:exodeoxyribonuclease V alpha subunit